MNVIERINLLKKMVKEVGRIVIWQSDIYTALHNIHADWVVSGRFPMARMPDMEVDKIMVGQGAGNNPIEEDKYSDVDVLAIIAARLKAGNVTDTTDASGEIAVAFAEAFASVPVVIVQLEEDVDYYSVVTAKDADGFTVKILKTAHLHTQGNTGGEAAHTHDISFVSGTGTAHRHSNPSTSYVSAGTPSGTIGAEAAHTHDISFVSGAGGAHHHTNPDTGSTSAEHRESNIHLPTSVETLYAASVSGGSPTTGFTATAGRIIRDMATAYHVHAQGDTGDESAHTHSVSGTSGAGSSHNHSFTGDALDTHRHTQSSTGYESTHTHTVSGTSGAGSNHSHTNPDTSTVNAGNALVTTAVTFSYIAMIP